jgi:hypothetical protein
MALNWAWILAAFKKKTGNTLRNKKASWVGFIFILARIGILVLATALVSIVLYSIIGQPSITRLHNQNEISRFSPTLDHGLIQLFGEMFLLALVVFIGIKWLRITL